MDTCRKRLWLRNFFLRPSTLGLRTSWDGAGGGTRTHTTASQRNETKLVSQSTKPEYEFFPLLLESLHVAFSQNALQRGVACGIPLSIANELVVKPDQQAPFLKIPADREAWQSRFHDLANQRAFCVLPIFTWIPIQWNHNGFLSFVDE